MQCVFDTFECVSISIVFLTRARSRSRALATRSPRFPEPPDILRPDRGVFVRGDPQPETQVARRTPVTPVAQRPEVVQVARAPALRHGHVVVSLPQVSRFRGIATRRDCGGAFIREPPGGLQDRNALRYARFRFQSLEKEIAIKTAQLAHASFQLKQLRSADAGHGFHAERLETGFSAKRVAELFA
tara:strand:+ start:197 stop:754 length:558 start_codon:yes stop_codon:yes gene_type:complete